MLEKQESQMNADQFLTFKFLIEKNSEMIFNWKKHQLRSVHQDLSRQYVLENLDDSSVLFIMDWAMKWIETRYREKQSDWFGKKGLPWHLIVAIRRVKTNSVPSFAASSDRNRFEYRTFCHIFDQCKQDALSIISILQDVFKRMKLNDPQFRYAYLRSDNGACYHNAITTTAIDEIYRNTDVFIRRIDFSEPQAGKGPCDRQASVIKGQIRRYIDEKHDCTNSVEFVAGAKSTNHLSIFASRIFQTEDSSSSNDSTRKSQKTTWCGISNIYNISYDIESSDESSSFSTNLMKKQVG